MTKLAQLLSEADAALAAGHVNKARRLVKQAFDLAKELQDQPKKEDVSADVYGGGLPPWGFVP